MHLSFGRVITENPSFVPGAWDHHWLLAKPFPGLWKQDCFPPGCHSQELSGQFLLVCDNHGWAGPCSRQRRALQALAEGSSANQGVSAPGRPSAVGASTSAGVGVDLAGRPTLEKGQSSTAGSKEMVMPSDAGSRGTWTGRGFAGVMCCSEEKQRVLATVAAGRASGVIAVSQGRCCAGGRWG